MIIQFLSFGIIGGIGFIVDAMVLYLMQNILGLYWARLLSFSLAVITTWILNRTFTFKIKYMQSFIKEFIVYFGAMIIGGVVNLSTYYMLLNYQLIFNNPIIAIAVGSIAGMAINFVSSKWFIFKG